MAPLMRLSLLLAILVGGSSIITGRGKSSPSTLDQRHTVNPLFGERLSAEIETPRDSMQIRVPTEAAYQTILAIASLERPRDITPFEITVTSTGVPDSPPLRWQPVKSETPARSTPILLSSTLMTEKSPTASAVDSSSKLETWFLPNRSSAHPESAAIQTREMVAGPRARVVCDVSLLYDQALCESCRPFTARLNSVVIPLVERTFGPVADRGPGELLSVVITPQVRQIQGGGTPVDAFVLASDYRLDLLRPHSNECDAIYLHPDLLTKPNDAILIHELLHAVQFCSYRRQYGANPWPLADWMLEGTAHAGEVLLSGQNTNVRDRLAAFAAQPERSPLIVLDSTREGLWRDQRSRGAAASFFTWIGQHYGLPALRHLVAADPSDSQVWRNATGTTRTEIERRWLQSLLESNTICPYPLAPEMPLSIDIQGGATGFVMLPETTSVNGVVLQIRTDKNRMWSGWLIRHRRDGSAGNPPTPVVTATSEPLSLRR